MTRNHAYKPKKPFKTIEGLGTEPWMRLSRNGVYVLDRFYKKFNGYNRSNLSLTYGEVKDKMSNRLFSSAIWENIGFGFIDIIKQGGLQKECSVYGLSNRWRKLCGEPGKLTKIEKLLSAIEILKRQRGSSKKRMKIRKIRNEILKLNVR